jgi:DNA invertase Pin-like site-specific DNA recombinase
VTKHVAVYVRVSSKQQTTASQLPDLQRWAAAQEEHFKWYEDQASGRRLEFARWHKSCATDGPRHQRASVPVSLR